LQHTNKPSHKDEHATDCELQHTNKPSHKDEHATDCELQHTNLVKVKWHRKSL